MTTTAFTLHDPIQLLIRARAGDVDSIGALLRSYSPYLTLVARIHVGKKLQMKIEPDDLVQETFLEAHRQFPQFRGTSEGELTAWLRRIMAGQIALTLRRYLGTRARDLNLERDLARQLDHSAHSVDAALISSGTSPSEGVARREQAVLLAQALNQLDEHYREVIILRHIEQLSFDDVAARMQRSKDSVQKLWVRALEKLRRALASSGEGAP